ncbi:MAG: hypothetical protein LBJ75_00965 [Puniceicoccales bacterium]|jgi:hypothetical protein|nr:hypothetical protein [Puniceicoccales bacterium]
MFALRYHIQAGFYTGVSIGTRDTLKRDFKFWVVTNVSQKILKKVMKENTEISGYRKNAGSNQLSHS